MAARPAMDGKAVYDTGGPPFAPRYRFVFRRFDPVDHDESENGPFLHSEEKGPVSDVPFKLLGGGVLAGSTDYFHRRPFPPPPGRQLT